MNDEGLQRDTKPQGGEPSLRRPQEYAEDSFALLSLINPILCEIKVTYWFPRSMAGTHADSDLCPSVRSPSVIEVSVALQDGRSLPRLRRQPTP